MTQQPPITVPVALSCTRSAVITLPWFVQHTENRPRPATYKPLVNGVKAFGALYDAIDQATRTIDYVCWGFQPSMYFVRDGKSLRIGDLLIKKAKAGVKVRILCWLDSAWIAQIGEQEVPGWTEGLRFMTQNEDAQQIAYDRNWYHNARLPAGGKPSGAAPAGSQMYTALREDPYQMFGVQSFKDIGIELVTRDFSMDERAEIMYREKLMRSTGDGPTRATIAAYGAEPSHHQKMVLIDYEAPEVAVGFVMGHNTLDAYWDDDGHSFVKKAPNRGRNGETPRQDMSAIVAGPILEHLNQNFCRAWQRDAKEDLSVKRNGLEKQLEPREQIRGHALVRVMAQINRTQSQEGVRNIEKLYLQAVNNATKFIYVENQYFRWPALAEKIKSAVQAQICAGRDPAKPVHLFVVTNANKDGIGQGPGTTYDMLNSLGRADTMPTIARSEQSDALGAALRDARKQVTAANTQMRNASGPQEQVAAQRAIDSAKVKETELQRQYDDNLDTKKAILPQTIPGLKVHVCSLVAPDSPAGSPWMPVYVHSKIMIIDDVFLTHGSANINRRSMQVDSELNICHERMDVTQPLRRHLWDVHTKGIQDGTSDDPNLAGVAWEYIIKRNSERQSGKTGTPIASLVGFMWTGASRLRLD
ncbi:phospholipase [Burkholderia sp. SRS-W-2-2016]|uniref:phospholipase D-like domain-containing protein n=1 Tax=Burkholderia sp. SRS-W-2-2016 TaxID=1926878 RepID=UPI00094AA79E|nr:phospholipase D-like domain-containing protein [Burkholderia sp. SRS-W-2-2016]OLL27344.1 phospholipase [Burkholderia sp. SRS-W-2-2016]